MKTKKIGENVVINYGEEISVVNNTIMSSNEDTFKAIILFDHITYYLYKIYKISFDKKEEDTLVNVYNTPTRISSNILAPKYKEMVVVINDTYW